MVHLMMQSNLPLPNRRQGKVRDLYDARLRDGSPALLLVATDRLSAFDVVMPNGIPGKGIVLTQLARFWFEMVQRKLADRLDHHLIATDTDLVEGLDATQRRWLDRRVMVGRKCRVLPVECIVRGYLAGSGWAEYRQSRTVCGIRLPGGLAPCDKLPQPIFTPSTKAASGHDENIGFDQCVRIVGIDLAERLRDLSLALYTMAHDYAAGRGIILADTKFEFGLPLEIDPENPEVDVKPILIDEVLTPDSSRFWPADQYQPGRDQPSFDKQYVRDYLQELVDKGQWDKSPPGPILPETIVRNTLTRYLEAYQRLTGQILRLD